MKKAVWHIITSAAIFACFCPSAIASLITYQFTSDLTSGPLVGTKFIGHFSYDSATGSGVGQEFINLNSLAFSIDGVQFTKADLHQGGQVITENGKASFFTGAFFPPPPDQSPVNVIAFGFGGPGVIGYEGRNGAPGSGSYSLTAVPEPGVAFIALLGCSLLITLGRRARC